MLENIHLSFIKHPSHQFLYVITWRQLEKTIKIYWPTFWW